MTYNVRYSAPAKTDIDIIDAYLSQYYPNTSPRFFQALDKRLSQLCNSPDMGTPFKNYRRLVVCDYLVFYQVHEAEKTVFVSRILHGSQNIDLLIGE